MTEPPGPGNQQELHLLAVQRVREGVLPRDYEARLFAGPGTNSSCALCNHIIGPQDIDYEVDSAKADLMPKPLHFHRACYFAWLQACE